MSEDNDFAKESMEHIIEEFERLEEFIDNRADKIFNKYKKHFMQGDERYSGIELDDWPYRIKWEVSWSYGGYDCGYINIPKEAFCGDWEKWVDEQIRIDKQRKKQKEKRIKANKIAEEKRKLKELKEKYE